MQRAISRESVLPYLNMVYIKAVDFGEDQSGLQAHQK